MGKAVLVGGTGGGSVSVGYVSSLVVVSHPRSLHLIFTCSSPRSLLPSWCQ